jgi:hypothetical protein
MKKEQLVVSVGICILAFVLAVSVASAPGIMSLAAEDVTVAYNEAGGINVSIINYNRTDLVSSFQINLTFEPTIMNVTGVTFNVTGLPQSENGANWVSLAAAPTGLEIPEGANYTLATINTIAKKNDGSSGYINITTSVVSFQDSAGNPTVTLSLPVINGTFTTLDEVPPTITFDVSEGATIAGPDIKVNATLYDLSGINKSSIAVKINDSSITNYSIAFDNSTTTIVNIHPTISELRAYKKLTVSASDNSSQHNSASNSVNVMVVESGFTIVYPGSDAIINETRPEIKVYYAQVNTSTIKILLNGSQVTPTIDDTNKTVTYTPGFDLPDKSHTVKVEGNSSLTGGLVSKEWNFTVDTTPPQIIYFSVSDSDGDGFNECREPLTVSWNVSDPNFDHVAVNDSTHEVTNNSSNSSINNWNSIYGNQEVTFKAVDKAGNFNPTTFHVYNNYVAYVTSNTSLSFGGIDLNRTAVMDLMNLSVSKVEFFGGRNIDAPTISSINRTVITGGKLPLDTTIIVDNNTNATITDTYKSLPVYNPGTNLSFRIMAPSVNRANVLLVQANSSRVDEFINGKPLNLTTLKNLLIDIKNNKTEYVGDVYFFGPNGYARIKINPDGTFENMGTWGTITVYTDNITKTLKVNEVNLTQGFSALYLASFQTTLPSGEYELIAFSLDAERTGLVATLPLVVANSTETGTVSPTTVRKGESLSVSFPVAEHTAVVLVKDVTYGIGVELNVSADNLYIGRVNFTSAGASQTSVNPSYTYGGKTINLSASFPTGYAAIGVSAGNFTSINTSNLVPGDYILYAVSEKDKKVEAIGRYAVKVVALKSIDVSPPSAELYVGETKTFTATAKDQDGNLMEGINITWRSSNTTVGTVSPASATTGSAGTATTTFTALAVGTTKITATNDTVSGEATVKVVSRPPVYAPGGAAYRPPVMNVPVDPATSAVRSTTILTVEKATLTVPEGTIVKDAAGNPLATSITMLYTPATAERIGAITAYEFGPSGTTFSPPIDLVIAYDPANIPAGYSESDLVIKMYDGTKWVDLATTVNTVAHTATAKVSHFSVFALFAAPPVAPPPTPTPTPTPTIPPVTPTPTPPVKPPVKIPWGLIIGIVIAVIILAGVAYYFYTKKRKA